MDFLVVLYSINVFITFSLSQLGMVRHWWAKREEVADWKRKISINGVGFLLTTFILVTLSVVKFFEGGWITLVVTGLLVAAAVLIKRHYNQTALDLRHLDELAAVVDMDKPDARRPASDSQPQPELDPKAKTAVVLVNGFNGLGLHTLFAVLRMFPGVFRNFVFVQVGVVDAGNFKGADEVENLKRHIQSGNQRYVDYLQSRGLSAEAVAAVGIDVVQKAAELAPDDLAAVPQRDLLRRPACLSP